MVAVDDDMSRPIISLLPILLVACVSGPPDEGGATAGQARIGPEWNVPRWELPDFDIEPPVQPRPIHVITENADGTFTPQVTDARDGDIVLWQLLERTGAVVPVDVAGAWPAPCSTPRPWSDTDPTNIAGPWIIAETGVYALSQINRGLVARATACPGATEVAQVGSQHLCQIGVDKQTMASTWSDPKVDGVFIRLLWNQLEPGDCSSSDLATCWDWSVLDRELNAAVANGKAYSLSVKAGSDGTPDWLFSTNPDDSPRTTAHGDVTRLHLQDSGNDTPGCGERMDLGDPTEPAYQAQYFDMLRALAGHLKTRSDWYRALAAVKPSGANLKSHENRLPKRCDTSAGCVCNTEVLATRGHTLPAGVDGYTPAKLYDFYQDQFALLAELFPGKPQSYALIQQGFPRITSASCYLIDNGPLGARASAGCLNGVADLPMPAEQTSTIMELGKAAAASAGHLWIVSHNGLGPTDDPNQDVLDAAADATTLTGFQTNNKDGVPDTMALDGTFKNLNSSAPEASYLEIYEERQWEAQQRVDGILDPNGSQLDLLQWGEILRGHFTSTFPHLGDPNSRDHAVYARYTAVSGIQTTVFVDPMRCADGPDRWGALRVTP